MYINVWVTIICSAEDGILFQTVSVEPEEGLAAVTNYCIDHWNEDYFGPIPEKDIGIRNTFFHRMNEHYWDSRSFPVKISEQPGGLEDLELNADQCELVYWALSNVPIGKAAISLNVPNAVITQQVLGLRQEFLKGFTGQPISKKRFSDAFSNVDSPSLYAPSTAVEESFHFLSKDYREVERLIKLVETKEAQEVPAEEP